MAERSTAKPRSVSADWLVQGVLAKVGDAFDRLTGRGWKPSSSLATSELSERLKSLVDAEARETTENRKFVPHNISLKMQWDKFSTDSETALKKLEHELLTSLVDHINDRRYYTYAPISLQVKPDYFTSGVKLSASFDTSSSDEAEAAVDVTVPGLNAEVPVSAEEAAIDTAEVTVKFRYEVAGQQVERTVEMTAGDRISIGRTNENDLALEDTSVSKMHATLLLTGAGELVVADTGSTNGTFIDGERIAYGKAVAYHAGQELRFGSVGLDVEVTARQKAAAPVETEPQSPNEVGKHRVGEFEFTSKSSETAGENVPAAPTLPSIPNPTLQAVKPSAESEADNGLEKAANEDRTSEKI